MENEKNSSTEGKSGENENVEKSSLSQQKEKLAENSRLLGVSSYFVFFLPYIINKEDSFALFHANQGFILFLLILAFNIVGTIIPFFGWLLIIPLGYLFSLVLLVMGAMNAWNGKKERLPFVGQFDLLK